MAVNFGITFPVSALAGVAVAVVAGVATAFSAVRVRGVSLAVVTLAGAVAIQNFGFTNTTWGGGATGSPVGCFPFVITMSAHTHCDNSKKRAISGLPNGPGSATRT